MAGVRGGGRRVGTSHRRVPSCGAAGRTWTSTNGDDYRRRPAVKGINDGVEQDDGERTRNSGMTTRRARQAHQTLGGTSCGRAATCGIVGAAMTRNRNSHINTAPYVVGSITDVDAVGIRTALVSCGGVERRGGARCRLVTGAFDSA